MGARQSIARVGRRLLDATQEDPAAQSQRTAEAVRRQQADELEELRAVVRALQEQLDRWSASTTSSIDAISERLAALEREDPRSRPR